MDTPEQIDLSPPPGNLDLLLDLTPALTQKRRSQARIIFDRFMRNRTAVAGAIVLILMFVFCFLGPFLTGHNNPDAINVSNISQTLSAPSLQFPLGTDDVGRDELARAMAGGQVSLLIGLTSMIVAIIVGVGLGAVSGYYGGVVDNVLMRFTDVILSVPLYLLLFVLSASFTDHTPRSVIILIAVLVWPAAARLARSEFLTHREREYVLAARTIGAGDLRVMFRHILPNTVGPIIVNATLLVGNNIILESVLSYFGFGIQPPFASWGNMISDGQGYFSVNPWLVLVPGLLIFLTVLSFNLVGDGLRDALDPRMTER